MVRIGLPPPTLCSAAIIWSCLHILPVEMGLDISRLDLRDWIHHLCFCSFQQCSHRWKSCTRCWWSRHRFWSNHTHQQACSSTSSTSMDWWHWCCLRACEYTWTTPGRLSDFDHLEMVFLDQRSNWRCVISMPCIFHTKHPICCQSCSDMARKDRPT